MGGAVEWLRRSNLNLVRSTRVGLNPVVGAPNHNLTANWAVHPFKVGKRVDRCNSEGTSGDAAGLYQMDSCPYTHLALTSKKEEMIKNKYKTRTKQERKNKSVIVIFIHELLKQLYKILVHCIVHHA